MMGFPVGFREMLASGGIVFVLLGLLSVYSIAVIWERWNFYRKSTADLNTFLARVRQDAVKGEAQQALAAAKAYKGLAGPVMAAALSARGGYDERSRAVERVIERQSARLDKGLVTLGTLGSVTPFIGLFGTVIGVIRAFKGLSGAGEAGAAALAIGIAEALVATGMGLFVAIPAVVAYNYFHARQKEFIDEVGRTAEELLDALEDGSPERVSRPR